MRKWSLLVPLFGLVLVPALGLPGPGPAPDRSLPSADRHQPASEPGPLSGGPVGSGRGAGGDSRGGPALPERGERPPAPAPALLPTPGDAVRWALGDLELLSPFDRPYVRYLFVQDGSDGSLKSASLTLNYVSRGSAIYRPYPVPLRNLPPGGGAGYHLLRVDLRLYAPRAGDLRDWLRVWEELAFDPLFGLLLTRDALDFADQALLDSVPPVTVKVKRQVQERNAKGELLWWSGDRTRPVLIEQVVEEVVPLRERLQDQVIRLNSPAVDPEALLLLQGLTGSSAPVVDHRYFKVRALTAVKDKKVFAQVFGGLYYDLKGIKKAKDALGRDTKATDLDLYFENLGIGNIQAGVGADALFDRLRSDQRLALFRSQVTGKPREVSAFHVLGDKEGGSWGAITGDIKDGDIDIGDRAFANLLTPRRQAREAIFPGANGFPVFALFDGAGALQVEVPPDVAVDSTIPAPHTRRLQPAVGCIRCHGGDGSDGWKPLTNDVKALTKEVDLFGDLSKKNRAEDFDTVDRLAGLYAGNFDKALRRARDDLAEVTLRATGPWGDGDQTDVAKTGATRLGDEFAAYVYDLVDAPAALADLGLKVDGKRAVPALKACLPPATAARGGGWFPRAVTFVPEDPRLAALKAGLGVSRADWGLAYGYAAARAAPRLAAVAKALEAE
jgi:hypothetical protein